MKKRAFRVGDIVTVNDGVLPVKRIGYPLTWTEIEDISADKELYDWVELFPGNWKEQRFIGEAIRKTFVQRQNFGGNRKEVIRDEPLELFKEAEKWEIIAKKTRYVGVYRRPSSWITGNMWGEPIEQTDSGGLDDAKAVIVLMISAVGKPWTLVDVLATDVRLADVQE